MRRSAAAVAGSCSSACSTLRPARAAPAVRGDNCDPGSRTVALPPDSLQQADRRAGRLHDTVPGVFGFSRLIMRVLLTLLVLLSLPAHADGFLSRLLHKPVPGGVAVIDLGDGPRHPKVSNLDKPARVVREDDRRWIAVVGVPLKTPAGRQTLLVDGKPRDFQVEERTYGE